MSSISLSNINTPSTGLNISGGNMSTPSTNILCGRFYLNQNWTPAISGWNYLPGNSISLATDVPPSVNSVVSATNSATQITLNNSNGLLYIPKTGSYNINFIILGATASATTTNLYELSLNTYFSPAWPATGQVAKSYGTGTANALNGIGASVLGRGSCVTFGVEGGINYTGPLVGGTVIAPLVYCPGSLTFNSMYLTVSMLQSYS